MLFAKALAAASSWKNFLNLWPYSRQSTTNGSPGQWRYALTETLGIRGLASKPQPQP
jgi:hypothetical protein